MKKRASFVLAGLGLWLGLAACSHHPEDFLTDPGASSIVPDPVNRWVIYDEGLNTIAGAFFFNGAQNQSNIFGVSGGYGGGRAIYFSWNGQPIAGQFGFAGFGIPIAESFEAAMARPALDLSGSGFTQFTFAARGRLSESTLLRVEAPDDGLSQTAAPRLDITDLSDTWKVYSLTVPTAALKDIHVFVEVFFVYTQPTGTTNPGGGGEVWLDKLTFSQ